MDNIRRRIVGVMFPPSIFEDRCVDFRRSMIDVSTFEDRGHDVSTFGDRCVDFRRSMCRPSEMDVLTFEFEALQLNRYNTTYSVYMLMQNRST